MSSMIRTFDRQMKREGKQIKMVNGKRQYVKVKPTNAESRKEQHDFKMKNKNVPANLYSSEGKFAKGETK